MGRPRKESDQQRPGGRFAGFGDSILARCARRPLQHLCFSRELETARREVRGQVPICPGIYGWLNADRSLIYVGKSKSLRHRLVSYFATETNDPKMARIRRESRILVWEPVSHELLALIREQELINRWRPPYNVEGQPDRRQPGFVCISRGTAPTLFFARKIPRKAADSFGPFAGRTRLSEAIVSLNHVFQIRDCPDKTGMHFSNQLQLFDNSRTAQCLRHELDSCPAPCAGGCSREAYRHNIDKALKFLRGSDTATLERLEQRMQRAADQRSYERACVLRDQLANLKWLYRKTRQLALVRRRLNGVWVLPGFDQHENWMMLRAGQLIRCTSGPTDPENQEAIADTRRLKPAVPVDNLNINLLLLLASWIRKHPKQLKQIRSFDEVADDSANQAASNAVKNGNVGAMPHATA